MKSKGTAILALLGALLIMPVAEAAAVPAFGPQTFERTTGATDLYQESFDAAEAGAFILYVRNGDGEATRVESATVELNGVAILTPPDFADEPGGFRRPIELVQGANDLVVEVAGAPGSFLTVAIGRPGEPPVFVHGRIVLPWGRDDSERALVLALKNGSPRAPRLARVVFFNPAGEVVAASPRFPLPAHGSIAATVDSLIAAGQWTIGSVEIFYAGPGVARLFGTARQVGLAGGQVETQPLEAAGHHVFRGRSGNDDPGRTRASR